MNRLINYPSWAVKIFTSLCLSQVLEQLPENVACDQPNPPSFVYNGQLFAFTHNRSLIADQPATGYGSFFN